MNQSPSIKNILPALFKVKSELAAVAKNADNPYFKSSYADLNSFLEECEPKLAKHGIVLLQPVVTTGQGDVLETLLLHESGEFISSSMSLQLEKADMQKAGSAVTYARRYTLQALLGMQAVDDDGNAAAGKVKNDSSKSAAKPAVKKKASTFKKPELSNGSGATDASKGGWS
jgi:hypothetical protein